MALIKLFHIKMISLQCLSARLDGYKEKKKIFSHFQQRQIEQNAFHLKLMNQKSHEIVLYGAHIANPLKQILNYLALPSYTLFTRLLCTFFLFVLFFFILQTTICVPQHYNYTKKYRSNSVLAKSKTRMKIVFLFEIRLRGV